MGVVIIVLHLLKQRPSAMGFGLGFIHIRLDSITLNKMRP